MSGIRSSGTQPEEVLFAMLREILGIRIKILRNPTELAGSPDLFVQRYRLAIFVHGCFWHCCPQHGRVPATNKSYWLPKLRANVQRDRRAERELRKQGMRIWRIWEHDLKPQRQRATSARIAARFQRLHEKTSLP